MLRGMFGCVQRSAHHDVSRTHKGDRLPVIHSCKLAAG